MSDTPENVPVAIPDDIVAEMNAAEARAADPSVEPFTVPGTPINDFLQIASGAGAVVETQAEWAGEGGILSNGFPTGIVLQEQYNKAWRQATAWIRVLGWHASQLIQQNVADDGNTEKLWRQLYEAFLVQHVIFDTSGTNAYTTPNTFGLTWTTPPRTGTEITLWINNVNTSTTCTLNFAGTGAFPIKHMDGTNPKIGDMTSPIRLSFTGGIWYIDYININMLNMRLNSQLITVTGDVDGSGTTAINLTLDSVNANPGTFQGITTNQKGLVTNMVDMAYVQTSNAIPIIKANSFGTLIEIFSTAGSFNYTVPAGCQLIQVFVIGGGGGSSASSGPDIVQGAIAGGGGGGCSVSYPIAVTPGQVIGFVVGAGGAAVGYGATGGNGGTSSFAGTYIATGGGGSSFAQTGGSGNASGGMFNILGSPGTSYGTGAANSAGGTGGRGAGPYGGGGGSTGTGLASPGGFPGGGAGGPGSGGSMSGHAGANGCVYVLR